MGSLCIFPLSSMESVFHFICGTTGSVVCLDCFAWVALVDSLLCTCTLGVVPIESVGGKPVAVSGTNVLIVQIFLEVVGCVVKVCGHLIFGNSTYPIALCLCCAKYDQSCHVGYFKYGWKCFIINMQVQDT